MQHVHDLLSPLIGRIAWGVGRGYGSFLHMEFGQPHLVVREPVMPRHAKSEKERRILLRRRVHVQGDWSFWIKYGDWRLKTPNGELDSTADPGSSSEECLKDFEGQKLMAVEPGHNSNSCLLTFDLGAALNIWPSAQMQDSQWSLYSWQGPIATFGHDGSISIEHPPGN